MSSRTPGASAAFPSGQLRQGFGRNWGNYVSAATLPNASGNALSLAHFTLEEGDCAWVIGDQLWECTSAGTAGGSDAVWIPTTVGPSNVLYVDGVLGSNTYGKRGNYARPFLTIQAALTASQTDDVVQLAPQTFALTAALTIPTATTRITIQGWGPGNAVSIANQAGITQITGAAGINIFELGSNLGLARVNIRNMTILWTNGNAINADGSIYAANAFLASGLWLENIQFGQGGTGFAIMGKYVRTLRVTNCYGTISNGGALYIESCGAVEFDHSWFPASNLDLIYNASDPLRTTTQNLTRIRATQIGGNSSGRGITLGGAPRLEGDQASRAGLIQGNSSVPLTAGALVPSIQFAGQIGTSGTGTAFDFSSAGRELPSTATALTVDFRGAKFFGSALFKVAGAALVQTVHMEGSQAFNNGTAITADAGIALRLDGAVVPDAVLTIVGTGTIVQGLSRSFDLNAPSITGTSPLVVGAVYLTNQTLLLASSNALVGTVAGGTGTLQLRRNGTGVLVPGASWSSTGVGIANAVLAAAVQITVTDWYTIELVGDAAPTVALAYGLRLNF